MMGAVKHINSSVFKNNCNLKIKSVITIILIILAINIVSFNLGYYSPIFIRFICVTSLMIVLLLNMNFSMKSNLDRNFIGGLALIILSFSMLITVEKTEFNLLSFPIFILGLNFVLKSNNKYMKKMPALLVGSLFYLIFYIIVFHIPQIWLVIRKLSLSLSEFIGAIIRVPLELGPSLSGLGILFCLLIFLLGFYLSSMKTPNDWKLLIKSSVVIIVIFVLLISMNFLPLFKGPDAINLLYIKFLVLISAFIFLTSKFELKAVPQGDMSLDGNQIFVLILLFMFIVSVMIFPYIGHDKKVKVLFYEKDSIMNFDPPRLPEKNEVFKPYQELSYGGLKQYLQTRGHDVKSFKEGDLLKELADTDILIMENINKSVGQENLKNIWEYVGSGGGLLISGDHTNMFVTKEEFNNGINYLDEVLNPTGIRIRNDTAENFRDYMKYNIVSYPHSITEGTSDLTITSVGASLILSKNAKPLIIGKYSFSDKANLSAPGYLGNMTYEDGEELGDIIFAASDTYGAGNVLVFGDTSYFFETSIPLKYKLIDNSIAWLTSKESHFLCLLPLISFIIILFLIIFLSLMGRFDFPKLAILFISFLTLTAMMALIVSGLINDQLITDHPFEKSRIAWIDRSHFNQFNLNGYSSNSIDGLIINLYRNQYIPLIKEDEDFSDLSKGNIFIIISPTSNYGKEQILHIEKFVEDGGLLIISAGYNNKIYLDPILKLFGIDIGETPLGSVPWIVETHNDQQLGTVTLENLKKFWNKPKFMEAHPVFAEGDFTPITWMKYQGVPYNLIISKPYGKGKIILIGDSRYLLNENLEQLTLDLGPDVEESKEQYQMQWLGNIELFSDIISKYEKGII